MEDAKLQNKFNKIRAHLKETFKNGDAEGKGLVKEGVFVKTVCDSGFNVNKEQAVKLAKRFQARDGKVKYVEFVGAIKHAGDLAITTSERHSGAASPRSPSHTPRNLSRTSNRLPSAHERNARESPMDYGGGARTPRTNTPRSSRGSGSIKIPASFAAKPRLNTAELRAVNKLISLLREKCSQKRTKIQKLFLLTDTDRDSQIDVHELKKVFEYFAIYISDAEAELVFRKFDPNEDGSIDYHEFVRDVQPSFEEDFLIQENTRHDRPPGHEMTRAERKEKALIAKNPRKAAEMRRIREEIESKIKGKKHMLREAFEGLAGSGGQVERGIFMQAVKDFNLYLSDEAIEELADWCDVDGDGFIDFGEFVQALRLDDKADKAFSGTNAPFGIEEDTASNQIRLAQELMSKRKRLQDMFMEYDYDGSGKISSEAFGELLDRMKIGSFSERDKEHLVRSLDVDGDGDISFQEFAAGLLQSHHPISDLMKPKGLRASGDIIGWATAPENAGKAPPPDIMTFKEKQKHMKRDSAAIAFADRPMTSNETAKNLDNPLLIKPLCSHVRDHLDNLPSDADHSFKYGLPSVPKGAPPHKMKDLINHQYLNQYAAQRKRAQEQAGGIMGKKEYNKFHTRASLHRNLEIQRKYNGAPPKEQFKLSKFQNMSPRIDTGVVHGATFENEPLTARF